MKSVHCPCADTLQVPIQDARQLFGYLDVRFRMMGLMARRYRVGTLELEFGNLEVRISEMDIWRSGFLEWISGSPVFSNGYLGLENGSPKI
jgi:hypothetical protein